jgi:hypothetical protein
MEIHFINVGCGNMTLLLYPNGTAHLYDCNLTEDNKKDTIGQRQLKVTSDDYQISGGLG